MRILITGGPVHGKLDDVKIITNRFRGGMIAEMANNLAENNEDFEVTYLTSKESVQPKPSSKGNLNIIYHDGFYSYYDQTLELCKTYDAVILGAAIVNLIPKEPFPGKFPSHNYKPGEEINIPFIIAPRIITEVKKINPKIKLFGFKLLSGVEHDYLIDVAHELCLETKADVIFANDNKDLSKKYAVMKEKSVIEFVQRDPADSANFFRFIAKTIRNKYFSTTVTPRVECCFSAVEQFNSLTEEFKEIFVQEKDFVFGSIAVKITPYDFLISARGKDESSDMAHVAYISLKSRTIIANKKASLNAPLIHQIFLNNPNAAFVLHGHDLKKAQKAYPQYIMNNPPVFPYAFPGTDRECSIMSHDTSFVVDHHGFYWILDKNKNLL